MVKGNQQKPLVSVAIVTWNRSKCVLRAIKSVNEQPYRPIEIVVIDSASTHNTVGIIKKEFPEVKVIELHRNMGCPEGRNIAIANCTGDIIFSLDDDAWLAANTLELCVAQFNMEPNLGVIGCRVVTPGETNPVKIDKEYTYVFSGGASALRREIIEKAKSEGGGWVDYFYLNPQTGKEEDKTTYLKKVWGFGDLLWCLPLKAFSSDSLPAPRIRDLI